jgi:hypothetical protein
MFSLEKKYHPRKVVSGDRYFRLINKDMREAQKMNFTCEKNAYE